jgi:serine/threonine-protein kinase
MFTLAVVAISVMMMFLGGLGSIYFGGVMLVIGARGAFGAERWQEGIVPNAVMVVAHVAAILGAVAWVPDWREQIRDAGALATFAVQLGLIISTASFGVIAGNTAWSLRRQVFEARNIGKYRLVRAIGRGGMGEVWRAYHPGLKREVAVKLLRPHPDASMTQRFEREVQATIRLSHPNTVRVFDYGVTDDGISYYVMELLQGCTLHQLVDREGPLDCARVVYLGAQAAGALAEAHDLGIVHRDVKPENIFVTAVGRTGDFVKILDFGIAKAINFDQGTALTQTGIRLGTPGYMAPEVFSEEAGAPADVYAMGAVLYFMLAGTPPFSGEDQRSLMIAQFAGPPPPPSTRGKRHVPSSLESVVQRCLRPNPSERFPNASALLDALQACRDVGSWEPAPSRVVEPAGNARTSGATMPTGDGSLPNASATIRRAQLEGEHTVPGSSTLASSHGRLGSISDK